MDLYVKLDFKGGHCYDIFCSEASKRLILPLLSRNFVCRNCASSSFFGKPKMGIFDPILTIFGPNSTNFRSRNSNLALNIIFMA